jgi:hypothetical protein
MSQIEFNSVKLKPLLRNQPQRHSIIPKFHFKINALKLKLNASKVLIFDGLECEKGGHTML